MLDYQPQEGSHLVVLAKGEPFMANLTEYCTQQNLKAAFFNAIGALEKVELGYYDLHRQSYLRKTFDEGDYELVSAHGNLTLKGGVPYVHIHASFSGPDFQVFGGHLFEAVVAVTAEVQVTPLDAYAIREPVKAIGLDLICRIHRG